MNQQAASEQASPQVSVVICTRNRGARIVDTIQSVLANTHPSFELLIFDQSTDGETAASVALFHDDARVRYVHSSTRGLGLARNLGLRLVQGEIVLMTDDDCEVAEDWVEQMLAEHTRHPQAAIVLCDVLPGPYDKAAGFIPNTIAYQDVLLASLRDWCRAGAANVGIGAGMGLRRALVQRLGGFDTRLGAGTDLYCAEETDLAVRALLHGYQIHRTSTTYVVHHGFRSFAEGRTLMRGYMFGIAATYTKLLRCGYVQIIPVLLYELWRTVLLPLFSSLTSLHRPPVLGRAMYLAKGMLKAWRIAIDRRREVFEPLYSTEPMSATETLKTQL
jgi:GT2 family glycosyltransferase